jgi:NAD+ kinase
MLNFKRIGIAGAQNNPLVEKTVRKIIHLIDHLGLVCLIDQRLGSFRESISFYEMIRNIDILLIVGGDGTFLRIIRQTLGINLPILGVHCGRLGFLTDLDPQRLHDAFVHIFIHHEYTQEERIVLECHDQEHGEPLLALNDFVVTQHDHQKMINFSLSVGHHFVCQERGDGIIISTPTGSTAYALSAGGPILTPQLDVLLIVPMFAHTLNLRPLVIPATESLTLLCETEQEVSIKINADGQESRLLSSPHLISVSKNSFKINLIHPIDHSFYHSLRKKLGWSSEHTEQKRR